MQFYGSGCSLFNVDGEWLQFSHIEMQSFHVGFVVILMLTLMFVTINANGSVSALSLIINTGKSQCIYQTVKIHENITVDYLVIRRIEYD